MDRKDLTDWITRLKREKARLDEVIRGLEQDGLNEAMTESSGELSTYDNHPADLGSEMFERSKDTALRDNTMVLRQSIEHALTRAAQGQFGRCEICGGRIEPDRLTALPWATTCIRCQRREEKPLATSRPLEEENLKSPFQRTFLDAASSENVGFDGEDAWQAVARWGSSDSPQDVPGSHDYQDLWHNSNETAGVVDNADVIPAAPWRQHRPRKRNANDAREKGIER